MQILANYLTILKDRFIALIQREPFDYTQWRQNLEAEDSIEDISRKAMGLRDSQELKTHTEI